MSTNNNKKNGNHFEEEFCELLALHGFWAHNMAQNQVGQPADVIAVKNGIPVLIDCKECETNRFPLSRIEGNQEGAMTLWEQTGNEHCYFAMKLKDGRIYMVSFDELMLRQLYGEGTITEKEFPQFCTTVLNNPVSGLKLQGHNIIGISLLNTRRAVALLTLSKVKPSFLKLYSLIIQDLLYSIVFCFQTPGRAGTLAA